MKNSIRLWIRSKIGHFFDCFRAEVAFVGENSTVPILCFVLYMNSIYKCAREKQSQKWYCKNVANLAGYYRTFYMYLYYVRAIAFWNKDVRSCWYALHRYQTFHVICLYFFVTFLSISVSVSHKLVKEHCTCFFTFSLPLLPIRYAYVYAHHTLSHLSVYLSIWLPICLYI